MQSMIEKDAAREARKESKFKAAFDKWLSEPMTRMGMSMVPAAEKQEALLLLLRSAFNAGTEAGSGNTAGEFMSAILESMQDKKKPAD